MPAPLNSSVAAFIDSASILVCKTWMAKCKQMGIDRFYELKARSE